MRFAALSLVLICAIAVPADAPSPLARAVELMRSDDPVQRDFGSRLAHDEIGKFLKPLYEAMKDLDPEVRRRARAALEGRYPDEKSEFTVPSWHPLQACGAPDANPNRDDPNAWATKRGNMGLQWLELSYRVPMRVARIRIHEVNSAGAVVRVDAVDARGKKRRLWDGKDPTARPGVFEITIPVTAAKVRSIRITLDTNRSTGWNEIDAVQIVGPDGRQWASAARASSTYATGVPKRIRR